MRRVHARWLMARARKGELTDPKGAAAHDETECVLRRHALASIPGPDWPRLAVGARQWRILRTRYKYTIFCRITIVSLVLPE